MVNNFNALNFSYLLLDFYKDLNITEEEFSVILMTDHLIENGNNLVTSDLLSLKMTMDIKRIDQCLTNLYKKKYIEIDLVYGKTSIEPLKKIVYSKFEQKLLSDKAIKENEELNKKREFLFDTFSSYFKRELSPIELSHIDDWILNSIDTDVIINSLKDAKNLNKLSINFIETIIIKKLNEE